MVINFTKNQTLILELFFNHPEKSYYFRELANLIGKQPGVFQKDINKLVEKGILLSEYQANSRFFKLNQRHHLYSEFKSIFLKTVGAVGKLKERLNGFKKIDLAFVFGSFAKNKEDQYSDVDLMIIGNPDEDKLVMVISKIESEIDREINYSIFSPADFKNGLKEEEVFLQDIMENPKIFIIGEQNDLARIIGQRRVAAEKSQPKRG
jgi:predicted nucleotidyltransferase